MTFCRAILVRLLLVTNIVLGVMPAQAQWLCVDPDGTISVETDASKGRCCEHWRHLASPDGQTPPDGRPTVFGTCPCDCRDYAIGSGDRAGPQAAVPHLCCPLALFPPQPSAELAAAPLAAAPRRHRWMSRPPDSPALACLKTVILLV